MTPEWIAFGQRAPATLVASQGDHFGALAHAVMSGLGERLIMAIPGRDANDSEDLMSAGAMACVMLPLSKTTVGTILSRLTHHSASARVDASLRLSMDAVSLIIRHQDRTARLTRREFALLHCLSARSGRAVAAEELLSVAWADKPNATSSRQVLDLYVHQLRKKLMIVGLDNVLATVRGFGYMLR